MAKDVAAMDSTIFYSLDSARLGTAVIINNLHSEQVDMPAPGKNLKFVFIQLKILAKKRRSAHKAFVQLLPWSRAGPSV